MLPWISETILHQWYQSNRFSKTYGFFMLLKIILIFIIYNYIRNKFQKNLQHRIFFRNKTKVIVLPEIVRASRFKLGTIDFLLFYLKNILLVLDTDFLTVLSQRSFMKKSDILRCKGQGCLKLFRAIPNSHAQGFIFGHVVVLQI